MIDNVAREQRRVDADYFAVVAHGIFASSHMGAGTLLEKPRPPKCRSPNVSFCLL